MTEQPQQPPDGDSDAKNDGSALQWYKPPSGRMPHD
jgi:hypothetical protein